MKAIGNFSAPACGWINVLLFFCLLSISYEVTAQSPQEAQDTESGSNLDDSSINNPVLGDDGVITPRTLPEWILAIGILMFGLFIMILEAYLIRVNKLTADVTVRLIIVTLIIIGTLFLIAAGYSNNQIAPATGLLGTIAGYILGRISNNPPAV